MKSEVVHLLNYFSKSVKVPFRSEGRIEDGVLRFAASHFEPYIYPNCSPTVCVLTGPYMVILEAIMKFLRVQNATIVNPVKEQYGANLGNGTFGGIMGRLQSGDAHCYLNPALSSPDRFEVTVPSDVLYTPLRLMTPKPSKKIDPFNFLQVFRPNVWTVLLISLAATAFYLFVSDNFVVRGRFGSAPISYGNYFWILLSRFFPQDSLRRREDWLRVCLLFFIFGVQMLFMNVFNGRLISYMALPEESEYARNFADLLNFPRVRIYGEANTAFSIMFTNATSRLLKQLNKRHIPITGGFAVSANFLQKLKQVEQGSHVLVGGDQMFLRIIEKLRHSRHGSCPSLTYNPESSGVLQSSILISRRIRKDLQDRISKGVQACVEAYLHHKGVEWELRKASFCVQLRETSLEPVEMKQILGTFVLLAIGDTAALAFCLVEIYRNKFI